MPYYSPAPLRIEAHETPETKRIYRMLMKFMPFAAKNFHEWNLRPTCGYFFTGCYWYGMDQNDMADLMAFMARFGDYDESVTGVPREKVLDMAIRAFRYACFTHDTGPVDCVRVDGRNRQQANSKWGGEYTPWGNTGRVRFFQSSQVGLAMVGFGLAAWFLWEHLDEETRQMAYDVIVYYAERWAEHEPRGGVHYDTQSEENGWTAMGINVAACMFPEDPRSEKWREGARRWMLDAAIVPLDMYSSVLDQYGNPQRKYVDHVTFHPDYTTENHGVVHPNYMMAALSQRTSMTLFTKLAGLPELPGLCHNWEKIYHKTFKLWASRDGSAVPVQTQDWWYYLPSNSVCVHTATRLLFDDAEAAYLEQIALDTLEATQAGHTSGCFVDNEPEKCIINPQQSQDLADMEPFYAIFLKHTYLLHYLYGEGVKPVTAADYERRLDAVRNFPQGGSVVSRKPDSFSVFSYRNSCLASVLPDDMLWTITTPPCGTFGIMEFAEEFPVDSGLSNQTVIRDMKDPLVFAHEDTLAASDVIDRGLGAVSQEVGFVTLPCGTAVYFERVRANRDCEIKSFLSGYVGVRNEYYEKLPQYAKGYRDLYVNDGEPVRVRGYVGGKDIIHDFEGPRYVALDDKIAYLVYGSAKARYIEHHNYPNWKGVEDYLILNAREDLHLKAGEELPPLVVVFLPNAGIDKAKTAYGRFTVAHDGNAAILNDYLVYKPRLSGIVSASFELSGTEIPVFEGVNTWRGGVLNWSARVDSAAWKTKAATLPADKDFEEICTPDGCVFMNR